jgi:hypothetical protein
MRGVLEEMKRLEIRSIFDCADGGNNCPGGQLECSVYYKEWGFERGKYGVALRMIWSC